MREYQPHALGDKRDTGAPPALPVLPSAAELGTRILRAARAAAAIDLIDRVRGAQAGAASEMPPNRTGG